MKLVSDNQVSLSSEETSSMALHIGYLTFKFQGGEALWHVGQLALRWYSLTYMDEYNKYCNILSSQCSWYRLKNDNSFCSFPARLVIANGVAAGGWLLIMILHGKKYRMFFPTAYVNWIQ